MSKILTQRFVESVKPPTKDRAYHADGLVPGMLLTVHASGAKTFVLGTRVHGKRKNIQIGNAGLLTLSDARKKGRETLARIANGEDPTTDKVTARAAAAQTVAVVVEDFVRLHCKVHNRPRSAKETERLLRVFVLPAWGARPIAAIKKGDGIRLFDEIALSAPISANRVLAAVKKLFNWAAERDLIEHAPFVRMRPPSKEAKRERSLSDRELALVLRAADRLGPVFGPFVKLLAYTGQRRDEVSGMEFREFNAARTEWLIAGDRTKNGIPTLVPIVPAVWSLIDDVPRIGDGRYVLTTNGTSPISGYSKLKIALDEAIADLNNGAPIPPWRLHDLRRTFSTGCARLGVRVEVTERILNHLSGKVSGVTAIYNTYEYSTEKREALERWTIHIASIMSDKVIRLRA